MGKIIAVVNQKGGVGKTTTAVNLTAALTEAGKRVLLCDFDPQANATSGLGLDKRHLRYSVYDVIINDVPAKDAIAKTDFGDVLPSTADLAGAGVELISMPEVALAWGSKSHSRTYRPSSWRAAVRLTAEEVLPTPPFWFTTASILPISYLLYLFSCFT